MTPVRSGDPQLEPLVEEDPAVRAAEERVRTALEAVMAGRAPAEVYSAAVLEWAEARRAARQRLAQRAAAPAPTATAVATGTRTDASTDAAEDLLDFELEETFPASDPLPGPTALT